MRTADGIVYTWGSGSFGQLGFVIDESPSFADMIVPVPTIVQFFKENSIIVDDVA